MNIPIKSQLHRADGFFGDNFLSIFFFFFFLAEGQKYMADIKLSEENFYQRFVKISAGLLGS